MRRSFRNHPAIAWFEQDHLTLDVQFGAALKDIADSFILARAWWLFVAGLLLLPQTHAEVNARGEVLLSHLATRRML